MEKTWLLLFWVRLLKFLTVCVCALVLCIYLLRTVFCFKAWEWGHFSNMRTFWSFNLAQLLPGCNVMSSGKGLCWPIKYMQGHIPAKFLCNADSVFCCLRCCCLDRRWNDHYYDHFQSCKILCQSIIKCCAVLWHLINLQSSRMFCTNVTFWNISDVSSGPETTTIVSRQGCFWF